MKADAIKALIPNEAELCAVFIREFNEQPGWTCYPETGGFDVLVAHEDGRQIGVEAKLQLNAKVADQILPGEQWHSWGRGGPDHRLVIVRSITEANAGIAKMLGMLGVHVWAPRVTHRIKERVPFEYEDCAEFDVHGKLWMSEEAAKPPMHEKYGHSWLAWFDWNPEQRIVLPEFPPSVPAGVPAPVQMTPWKMAAIRVLARLRVQGYITAKQIVAEGVSPSLGPEPRARAGRAAIRTAILSFRAAGRRRHAAPHRYQQAASAAANRASSRCELKKDMGAAHVVVISHRQQQVVA